MEVRDREWLIDRKMDRALGRLLREGTLRRDTLVLQDEFSLRILSDQRLVGVQFHLCRCTVAELYV